ncbi:unnamed protein product [Scytosiphon promiscuus]
MGACTADPPRSEETRLIILGCGLAGLRCAQVLNRKHGFSTDELVLLEASTAIGGRIKTDTSFVEGFSLDLGAELIHGDGTSLYRLAMEKGWEMEELISLAQGDGGPLPAEGNDGFGLFYLGGEKRMLGMDSKDPDFVHLNNYLGSLADLWPAIKTKDADLKLETDKDSPMASEIASSSVAAGAVEVDVNATTAAQAEAQTSTEKAEARPAGGETTEGDTAAGAKADSTTIASPSGLQHQPLTLRDGLVAAGVGDAMMGIADAGYANTVGAALEDTSLAGTCFLEHEWDVDGDRTFVLKGSLGQVVDELSGGLERCIQTDWPVAKVDYTTEGLVTVTCRDGRIERGTHVVSALPLSVLQDGDVEFSPALPAAKLTAFQRMGMCSVVKVILKFDRPVLPPLLHGCICSESFIPEFWFRHMPNLPEGGYTMLAVGYTAGPPADVASALTEEQALKKALDQLDDMFRGRVWLAGGRCTGKGDWEALIGGATPEEGVADGSHAGHAEQPGEGSDTQDKVPRESWTNGGKVQDQVGGKRLPGTSCQGRSGEADPLEPCTAAGVDGGAKKESENGAGQSRERIHRDAEERGVGGEANEGNAVDLPSTAYVGGLVHDWVRDEPFVRGGYCYPKVGFDENTHADAAASVGGSLFFAGEHTNTPTGMTVHAAIDSGERAALEISEAVQRKAVQPSGTVAQAPQRKGEEVHP